MMIERWTDGREMMKRQIGNRWMDRQMMDRYIIERKIDGKDQRSLKRIRDAKGTFHAKMGTIKDRNDMDLTEAEDIKRGGKNTQKNYTKKIFMTQIITMM